MKKTRLNERVVSTIEAACIEVDKTRSNMYVFAVAFDTEFNVISSYANVEDDVVNELGEKHDGHCEARLLKDINSANQVVDILVSVVPCSLCWDKMKHNKLINRIIYILDNPRKGMRKYILEAKMSGKLIKIDDWADNYTIKNIVNSPAIYLSLTRFIIYMMNRNDVDNCHFKNDIIAMELRARLIPGSVVPQVTTIIN